MGREQELLEAARSGNVSLVEKLLTPRKKMTVGSLPLSLGPFQSLRRAPNPNCHDQNGDTPLHLAALNGHIESVKVLLKHEGSANVMDTKGCYPLHLAAWSGNAEMCNILLSHGPSLAKVNEQNQCGETALHCAAQYGHKTTVAVLLSHLADPRLRNNHAESPLDLAAQYGRLDTVELLIRKHPGLLADGDGDTVSPLHLASKNGHKHVVQILIDSGYDINKITDSGTALHEAAIFGKQDVVRLLLKKGINANSTDAAGRTALEVLSEHKSQLSLDIGRLILDYLEGRSISDKRSSNQSGSSDLLDPGSSERPASESDALIGADRRLSARSSGDSSIFGASGGNRYSSISEGYGIYDTPKNRPIPPGLDQVDAASETSGSPLSTTGGTSLSSLVNSGSNISVVTRSPQGTPLAATPETPKKPPRRKPPSSIVSSAKTTATSASPPRMVFITKRSSATSRDSASGSDKSDRTDSPTFSDTRGINNNNGGNDNVATAVQNDNEKCDNSKTDGVCAPRDDLAVRRSSQADFVNSNHQREPLSDRDETSSSSSTQAADRRSHNGDISVDNNNDVAKVSSVNNHESAGNATPEHRLSKRPAEHDSFTGSHSKEVKGQGHSGSLRNTSDIQRDRKSHPRPATCEMGASKSSVAKGATEREASPPRPPSQPSSRPPSLDFSSKRSSVEVPLSPTGYQQPPTPDHPPPSPMTAVLGIQEKINPKDKRRSRDMETITEAEFLLSQPGGSTTTRDPSNTVFSRTDTDSLEGSTASSTSQHSHSPGGDTSLLRKKVRAGSQGSRGSGDSDCGVEVITNGNNPFLGLTKGAIPKGQRRVKSQIFDNLPHIPRNKKRISAPGLSTFDPLMEEEGGKEVTPQTRDPGPPGVRVSLRKSFIHAAGRSDGDRADSSLNETEEWAQIADILSSCGGRMSTSEYSDYTDFERRLQKIFAEEKGRMCVQSVGDWLEDLGLPQYENILVANGFDDMDFLGPNVLEESDLLELGVVDVSHRSKILEESKKLSPIKPIVEIKTPSSLEEWLQSLRLSDYLETFQINNFTTMDRVRNIWELELNSVLDINTLGHRKRILASLRVPPEADTVSQSDDFLDFTKITDWTGKASENEGLANLNFYKDYTNVRPRSRHREEGAEPTQEGAEFYDESGVDEGPCDICEQEQNGAQGVADEGAEVQIRPPNNSSAESTGVKQWRHQPEVLIKGCCNYTVQYLGSTLVKSLQGTESTRESIHKMKKTSDSLAKVPSVVLSVSYRGVKFIDARTKHVICEHDISNIFCACQDGENLNYFAYITRDHVTERHYCHVFCVRSTELATEIILTLGEAFEVAYQVAIRERVIEEEEEEEGMYEGQGYDPGVSTTSSQVAAPTQEETTNTLQGATAAVDS